MNQENLGDWCKWLEQHFSPEIMIPKLPVIIRLDGNNFSTYTKSLNKPFDERFSDLMVATTKFLVEKTNAVIGYTVSDEITLILYSDNLKKSIFNDGKKQKIVSKLSAFCSNYFNQNLSKFIPEKNEFVIFDCRVYQTPTLDDATLQLLWRENDGTRNSISTLARSYYSHKKVEFMNSSQLQDMLMAEKQVNWNDLPSKFKRGTYIRRVKTSKPFTAAEIESLPEKHQARKNPDLVIERNIVSIIDMPIFGKVTNKVAVVFKDDEPITKTE